jgi:4-hydroxybenzoate polyprenyltransferase
LVRRFLRLFEVTMQSMTPKDILLHLRLPFSLFLMPVYWFAVSQVTEVDTTKAIWVFVILHLLIYPASNAYNSYFDKDEGSIGGLEKPPAVGRELFWVATALDIIGCLLGVFFVSYIFGIMVLIYINVSRAYSYDGIRLKKYAILSWITVGLFQGAFTYLMVFRGVDKLVLPWNDLLQVTWLPMLICSLILWAVYPMTQIYQHEEDAARGDITLSQKLGIKGSFIFTGLLFGVAFFGFYNYLTINNFIVLLLINTPTVLFFGWWFLKVLKSEANANFKNTMWLNLLASFCMNAFYIYLVIMR